MGSFGGPFAAGIKGSENERSESESDEAELGGNKLGPLDGEPSGEDAVGCGTGAVSAVTGRLTGGSAEGALGGAKGPEGALGRAPMDKGARPSAPMDEGALGAARGTRGGSGGGTLPERRASGSWAVTSFEPLTDLLLSLMGTGLT